VLRATREWESEESEESGGGDDGRGRCDLEECSITSMVDVFAVLYLHVIFVDSCLIIPRLAL
jgi:hypothetical protein